MQSYILLGATGYMGQAFAEELNSRGGYHHAISRHDIDYTDLAVNSHFEGFLRECKGNVLINCAGYIGKPNVDACEKAKYDTLLGNVVLPQHLARVCLDYGITFVHISSGCIYSGSELFTEKDKPNFSFDTGGSFYSGTKALAEDVITRVNPMAYQFRLRIPFDQHASPRNYLTKCLSYDRLIEVHNSISHREDFVQACLDMVEGAGPPGIYNVVNPGPVYTSDVTSILEMYGHLPKDGAFEFFDNYDAFTSETVAARSNCTLSSDKIESCVNIRSAEEALHEACKIYS